MPGWTSGSDTYKQPDLGPFNLPLCASVSSMVKWGQESFLEEVTSKMLNKEEPGEEVARQAFQAMGHQQRSE